MENVQNNKDKNTSKNQKPHEKIKRVYPLRKEEIRQLYDNITKFFENLNNIAEPSTQNQTISEEIKNFYTRYLIGLKRYLKDKENEILIGETRHLQEIYGNIQEHEEKLTELETKILITLEYLHYVVVFPRVFSKELRQEFEDRETASQSSMNLIMETGW